ncbi:MAG: hypothetical protein WDW36_007578 [Sanguina aurantia]
MAPFSQDSDNVQLSVPWKAKIREGLLLLARDTAGQNTQLLRVPLAGVTVRLAQEWSGSKSDWWKRAPIELSHPDKKRLRLSGSDGDSAIQPGWGSDPGGHGSVLLLFADSGEFLMAWCTARDAPLSSGFRQGLQLPRW